MRSCHFTLFHMTCSGSGKAIELEISKRLFVAYAKCNSMLLPIWPLVMHILMAGKPLSLSPYKSSKVEIMA